MGIKNGNGSQTKQRKISLIMNKLKNINLQNAVSFSGHRPERLPGQGKPNNVETQKFIAVMQEQIASAVNRGKHIFINGAMAGFDIFAAEQVIEMKSLYPQIQLVTIAPYRTHFFNREKCWTAEWRERAKKVFDKHDMGVVVANDYRSGIYYERNRDLVDNSSELLCFWDGKSSGTKYTVDYAKQKGKQVTNVAEMFNQ